MLQKHHMAKELGGVIFNYLSLGRQYKLLIVCDFSIFFVLDSIELFIIVFIALNAPASDRSQNIIFHIVEFVLPRTLSTNSHRTIFLQLASSPFRT